MSARKTIAVLFVLSCFNSTVAAIWGNDLALFVAAAGTGFIAGMSVSMAMGVRLLPEVTEEDADA